MLYVTGSQTLPLRDICGVRRRNPKRVKLFNTRQRTVYYVSVTKRMIRKGWKIYHRQAAAKDKHKCLARWRD